MTYKHLESDFVNRTLEILDQYDKIAIQNDQKREVTLLVNSFLGLIVVPKSTGLFNHLPNKRIEELSDWGLSRTQVADVHIKTIRDLMIELRNSAAHFDVSFEGTPQQIETIIFSDSENGNKEIARFDALELRTIIERIAREMLSNYKTYGKAKENVS